MLHRVVAPPASGVGVDIPPEQVVEVELEVVDSPPEPAVEVEVEPEVADSHSIEAVLHFQLRLLILPVRRNTHKISYQVLFHDYNDYIAPFVFPPFSQGLWKFI